MRINYAKCDLLTLGLMRMRTTILLDCFAAKLVLSQLSTWGCPFISLSLREKIFSLWWINSLKEWLAGEANSSIVLENSPF